MENTGRFFYELQISYHANVCAKYAIDFVIYALVCLTPLLYLPHLIYATPLMYQYEQNDYPSFF